jgi:hypothetical protein
VTDYFTRRRERADRAELLRQEFDSRAADVAPLLIEGAVGPGWLPLVRDLHGVLIGFDPQYRLLRVARTGGRLTFEARFALRMANACVAAVEWAVDEAARICELCEAEGRVRENRPDPATLCDVCSGADRLLAAKRGEYFASLALAKSLSNDAEFPDPEEVVRRRQPPPECP